MNCEYCGVDPNPVVLLNKPQPDGRLTIYSCQDCAIEAGMFCSKHQRPHLGFMDETSACLRCIDEQVAAEGEKIAGALTGRLISSDKREEVEVTLNDWYESMMVESRYVGMADLSMALKVRRATHATNIARLVVTKAQRMNIEPEDVIEQVARMGPRVIFS